MRAGFFLRGLRGILLTSYSALDVAEIRAYDWDGQFPRHEWHGWTDLFGTPYSVLFNTGEQVREGGWIDVRHLSRLPITAKITAGAGIAGMATLIFQGAMDLVSLIMSENPTDMQFSADVVASAETETHDIIDVQRWNYIRFHSINNLANGAVNLRIVTHDGVTPINLP